MKKLSGRKSDVSHSLFFYFIDFPFLVWNYDENGVHYLDPSIKAEWGVEDPITSDRDKQNPLKKDIPELKKAYYGIRN